MGLLTSTLFAKVMFSLECIQDTSKSVKEIFSEHHSCLKQHYMLWHMFGFSVVAVEVAQQ